MKFIAIIISKSIQFFLKGPKFKKERVMKRNRMIYTALAVLIVIVMFVPACQQKKRISSQPTMTTSEEEAQRRAQEEARQKELERQKAIEEDTLQEEGVEEAGLSEEMEKERKLTEQAVFENEDIHFEFDSILLSPQAQEILRKKAQWLRENPRVRVVIEGHCDNRGTNEYNLALGDRRAHSAKVFLIDLGIDETRMQTLSFGEERPLDPGDNEQAWARNRRAHFVITK